VALIASRYLLILVLLLASVTAARSQTKFTSLGPAEHSNLPVVRDALGRPCLDVEATSRPHVVNRDMIDHIVSVNNKCNRSIQVKVCYFQTDNCKEFRIQNYGRVDSILGTMNKSSLFRYSVFQN